MKSKTDFERTKEFLESLGIEYKVLDKTEIHPILTGPDNDLKWEYGVIEKWESTVYFDTVIQFHDGGFGYSFWTNFYFDNGKFVAHGIFE